MVKKKQLSPDLKLLQAVARSVVASLSMEHYMQQVFERVPDTEWKALMTSPASWHHRYFVQAPQELVGQFVQDAKDAGHDLPKWRQVSNEVALLALFEGGELQAREGVAIAQDLLRHDGPLRIDLGGDDPSEFVQWLVTFKARLADIRAFAFYGQSMVELCAAGVRGNDKGFVLAVSIDPTVQHAAPVVKRLSADAAIGRTDFAKTLQKASAGPSGRIEPELHQLRYVLGVLRAFGLLSGMSDAQRYEMFCKQLGLYPDSGKNGANAKAALCTFIKRWERDLVL